jgi:hypothetical protein
MKRKGPFDGTFSLETFVRELRATRTSKMFTQHFQATVDRSGGLGWQTHRNG